MRARPTPLSALLLALALSGAVAPAATAVPAPTMVGSATTTPAPDESGSASPTPTVESPSPTESSTSPSPTPTSESPSPTLTTASPTPTQTPTSASPTPTATSASPTPTTEPDPSDGLPAGLPLWIGLGAAALVAALAAGLMIRRSRRRRWDEGLEVERTQARWVLDPLVPTVTDRNASPATVAAQWAGAAPVLDQLQAGLTRLALDAPDPDRAQQVHRIGSAVAALRQAVAADVALRGAGVAADPTVLATSFVAVQQARDTLAGSIATSV